MVESILIISVGSRGDTEPFFSLSSFLIRSNENLHVHQVLSSDYRDVAPKHDRIHLHRIPMLTIAAFLHAMKYLYQPPTTRPESGDEPDLGSQMLAMGAITEHCVNKSFEPIFDIMKNDMQNPIGIVCTTLAMVVAKSLSDYYGIPCYPLHFQPNTPSSYFPCYLSSKDNAIKVYEIISAQNLGEQVSNEDYLKSHDALLVFFKDSLPGVNEMRRSLLNLDSDITVQDVREMLQGKSENVHVIHSYMNMLHPTKIPDVSKLPGVHYVDPLADLYIPDGWTPEDKCRRTLEFVQSCKMLKEKLICVSIGSMRLSHELSEEIASSISSALQNFDKNCKVILFASSQLVPPENDTWWRYHTKEICEENVQFAWLFQQCDIVLCHGGAGVVAAACASGTPCIVAPVMVDQWMWAGFVEAAGLGAAMWKGLHGVEETELTAALRKVDSEHCKKSCAEYKQNRCKKGDAGCKSVEKIIQLNTKK